MSYELWLNRQFAGNQFCYMPLEKNFGINSKKKYFLWLQNHFEVFRWNFSPIIYF